MTPSGLSALGVVAHLAGVEVGWFDETFARRARRPRVGGARRLPAARRRHGRVGASPSTTRRARSRGDRGTRRRRSTRRAWMLRRRTRRGERCAGSCVHMIDETARHAGHLDLMCEHSTDTRRRPRRHGASPMPARRARAELGDARGVRASATTAAMIEQRVETEVGEVRAATVLDAGELASGSGDRHDGRGPAAGRRRASRPHPVRGLGGHRATANVESTAGSCPRLVDGLWTAADGRPRSTAVWTTRSGACG